MHCYNYSVKCIVRLCQSSIANLERAERIANEIGAGHQTVTKRAIREGLKKRAESRQLTLHNNLAAKAELAPHPT